jgi:hypothetical protein
MAWTEEELQGYRARGGRVVGEGPPAVAIVPLPQGPRTETRPDAYANKLERRYAETVLAPELAKGTLKAWWYEPLKLRLAKACFYTPDFLLQYADDHLQMHETKGGFWRDDARVKIKVAARLYPCFTFRAVQYSKGVWRYEDF